MPCPAPGYSAKPRTHGYGLPLRPRRKPVMAKRFPHLGEALIGAGLG